MHFHPFRRASNDLTEKDADRFWSKVTIGLVDECWEWQAYRGPKGYGQFGIGRNRLEKSSRVAWALTHDGVFPELCVLHSCDNPPCCNPKHLFLGSRKNNNDDMQSKGRASIQQKLSTDQANEVRARARAGEPTRELAMEFGVSQACVCNIRAGRTRKEGGGP